MRFSLTNWSGSNIESAGESNSASIASDVEVGEKVLYYHDQCGRLLLDQKLINFTE
jgi:hypothetical protein